MNSFDINSRRIIETILVILLFMALLIALYDVLQVFFGILTFALIFAVSFGDPFEKFVVLLRGQRKIAAIIYTSLLLFIVALPMILLISGLHAHIHELANWIETFKDGNLPVLPQWLTQLPLIGHEISIFWTHLQTSPKELVHQYSDQFKSAFQHAMSGGAGVIGVSFQFMMGIVISAFLLVSRKTLFPPIKSTAQHLFGKRDGETLLQTTTQAIKGVAIGVMGTAFITAAVSWIGLTIAGIPFSIGLSALIFFMVVIQIGPIIVWLPLTIWTFMQGNMGMGIFLIVYGIIIVVIENIARPLLIAKSGKLPFLILFIGVIGGMSAWGFTGMFKGAIIVSVFYTVFNSWLDKKNATLDAS